MTQFQLGFDDAWNEKPIALCMDGEYLRGYWFGADARKGYEIVRERVNAK